MIPFSLCHPFISNDRQVDGMHHRYTRDLRQFATDIEQSRTAYMGVNNINGTPGIQFCLYPFDTFNRIKYFYLVMPQPGKVVSPLLSSRSNMDRPWNC